MLTRRLLPILALFATLLAAPAAVAAPPDVECPPGQTDCQIVDETPGGGGNNGGGNNGGGSSGGNDKCFRGEEEVPCYDPIFGWFNRDDGCYYKLTEPQLPPKDDSPDGAWYTPTCLAGVGEPDWFPDPPGGTPPSPVTLARRALAAITLAVPDINIKPDQGPGLVGLPVWLWVGRSPNTWGPIRNSASDSGLTVEITARVTRLSFDLGNGKTIECPTGGTPYPKGAKGPSPDCGHLYDKAGEYTIEATTSWTVDWESSAGGSGTLDENPTRVATGDIQIDELQVVTR
ncbi:hypothetical protein [Phytohabitans aurantiacus]|uniref:ATP/GTP-binding protein n=1 Tax=Phytohabitans aurantiacus TaxID=3016789 RepID=A0ABQ5QLB1_9ACTN|nr:hypothetical protein [Phytohabitans aurantiacus]GLH94954.1 ATP/GTP-binding protein [Phytohabitans aurantiacus]